MRRRPLALASLALALVPAALATPAAAQEEITPLAVNGRGVVEARPDRGEVRYVLEQDAASREAARASVARRSRILLRRLRRLGVAPEGVRLSSVRIGRPSSREDEPRPYRAVGVVAARTERLRLTGRMLDLAPGVRADVRGPAYDLVDDLAARVDATGRAVTSARRRAEVVAAGLGLRIVRVRAVTLDRAFISRPEPVPAAGERRDSAGGDGGGAGRVTTPSAPGTLRVTARVSVTFELAP